MTKNITPALQQLKRKAVFSIVAALVLNIIGLGGFLIGYKQVKAPFLIVLNFHGVVEKPAYPWEITWSGLNKILNALEKHDFKPITPKNFEEKFNQRDFSSGRYYLVTFDDGLESSVTAIKKLYEQRGISSAFFIVTNLVGSKNYTDYPTLETLKNDFSCKIGLHGKRHYEVTKIIEEGQDLLKELEEARMILARKTGAVIDWYAYPFGEYNDTAVSILASSSLKLSFTVDGYEVDNKADAKLIPRVMYLKGGKKAGATTPMQYAPPREVKMGSLTITLSCLVFMIGFSWIIRARRLLTACKEIKKQSSL